MKAKFTKIGYGVYLHSSGTRIEKNSNPTGIRNWWITGNNPVADLAASMGCLGGFFKLSKAKEAIITANLKLYL